MWTPSPATAVLCLPGCPPAVTRARLPDPPPFNLTQVFTQPTAALAALVTRVFEQRVQFAVDQALSWRGVPDPPSASDLRAHLRQLAEAVAMTRGLASDAQVGVVCDEKHGNAVWGKC